MQKDDWVRLRHMLEASKEVISFMAGQNRQSLEKNRMLALSLIRLIEIIGEAATKITKQFQKDHPEIPWAQIVTMRHRLIHAYFDVDLDRVWDTAQKDIPSLLSMLEKVVPANPPSS
jgi:uncharacterized protein with HEPN domain